MQNEQRLNPTEEHHVRLEKVKKLRELGIEPWPEAKEVEHSCQQVIDEFDENTKKQYSIAGRIMTVRLHGKAAFATIQDESGTVQIYIKKDEVGEAQFDLFKDLIDMGDIVWVYGYTFKTKTGQITLHIEKLELLSKCLYPLPDKFHGLHDVETKYRQRYLDLMTDESTRDRFIKRSLVLREMRNYLDRHGFLEVETPMLHPIAGGAAARPFITHHNAYDSDFYLRIAPELYLKRLIVGGFEQVYEINRNFRNEGVSTRHNPEFTMVEFYWAHREYQFIMSFVEKMLEDIARVACGSTKIPFGELTLNFKAPFAKMTIKQAVMHYCKLSEADLAADTIDALLTRLKVTKIRKNASLGEKIYAIFEEVVESQIIQPTFITEFPIEVSPLSKRDKNNPEYAARFELFIAGMEIANGFNELNDPFDQAGRFKQQLQAFDEGDKEAHQYDADYVNALEHAMPPTVGVGLGIDRFVMMLTNTTSIKEVILFPTLKKKQ